LQCFYGCAAKTASFKSERRENDSYSPVKIKISLLRTLLLTIENPGHMIEPDEARKLDIALSMIIGSWQELAAFAELLRQADPEFRIIGMSFETLLTAYITVLKIALKRFAEEGRDGDGFQKSLEDIRSLPKTLDLGDHAMIFELLVPLRKLIGQLNR